MGVIIDIDRSAGFGVDFWYITPDGFRVELEFDDDRVLGFDEFGSVDPVLVRATGINQSGSTYLLHYHPERFISMRLKRKTCGCWGICQKVIELEPIMCDGEIIQCADDEIECPVPQEEIECKRRGECSYCNRHLLSLAYLTNYLRNNRGGMATLYVRDCDGNTRFIKVKTSVMPSFGFGEGIDLPRFYETDIQFLAPSPYWCGEEIVEEFELTPIPESLLCGVDTIYCDADVVTECPDPSAPRSGEIITQTCGTVKSFAQIRITGPMNEPIIDNLSTGERIRLDYNIVAGEAVTIEMRPTEENAPRKLAYSTRSGDITGTVDNLSDFATFGIQIAPIVSLGRNKIRVSGTSITDLTTVKLTYNEKFLGVPL